MNMRVLMVSHAHPARVAGGAQQAAHLLWDEVCSSGVEAWFLAHDRRDGGLATFSSYGRTGREILFHTNGADPFTFSQEHMWFVWHDFAELLAQVRPTVVHFQHYASVGVDLIRAVRNWNPATALVLTLHEFLAICHNNGQMVKRKPGFQLCHRADSRSCHECFPDRRPEDFFLRQRFIRSHFELIDTFIAPSHFLKARYVDWGLPAERIEIAENGTHVPGEAPRTRARMSDSRMHFAFFGKVFKAKGIFVLLDAIESLAPSVRDACRFSIYGAGIEEEPSSVQADFYARLRRLNRWVRCHGRYDQDELDRLMADVDWLVVPSLWWENSPLVIQEAFARQIPVICSDIGGMAEKVQHGIDGLHFRVNDPHDLARVVEEACSTRSHRDTFTKRIRPPPTVKESAVWHTQLYERATAARRAIHGLRGPRDDARSNEPS